jgi:hypothetical protein
LYFKTLRGWAVLNEGKLEGFTRFGKGRLYVGPGFVFANVIDRVGGYFKDLRQSIDCVKNWISGPEILYSTNPDFIELAVPVQTSNLWLTNPATFVVHILDIIGIGSWENMIRVTTHRIIASMTGKYSVRDFPDFQHKSDATGNPVFVAYLDRTIAIGKFEPGPFPTFVRTAFVNVFPESFNIMSRNVQNNSFFGSRLFTMLTCRAHRPGQRRAGLRPVSIPISPGREERFTGVMTGCWPGVTDVI